MLVGINLENGKIKTKEQNINNKTFVDWKLKESDIEVFVEKNLSLVFGEEETVMIIGRQITDNNNNRSDLIAIDGDGNLVLIEIKRDLNDIKGRKETFVAQSIKYAATLSSIESVEDLATQIYAKYI